MLRKRKKYKISSISILCTGTLSWPESFCVILFTWWVPYGINVVLDRKTPTFGPVTKRLQHYGLVHTMLHYTLITALCCIIPWLQHYAALYPDYSLPVWFDPHSWLQLTCMVWPSQLINKAYLYCLTLTADYSLPVLFDPHSWLQLTCIVCPSQLITAYMNGLTLTADNSLPVWFDPHSWGSHLQTLRPTWGPPGRTEYWNGILKK